jgi:putative ABC transport system permease protein
LAREISTDGDVVGKQIDVGFGPTEWRQIVGVVGDTKQDGLLRNSFALYQPYLQVTRMWQMSTLNFVVRVSGTPAGFSADLRTALQDVDKALPVYDIKPLGQLVSEKVSDNRFYASLLSCFSLIALLLAAAGIYGLTSYSVTQRTHEIGIRVALGASQGDVVGMIVRKGLVNTAFGIIIGLAVAFAATRLLDEFLYGVITPTDPWTFVAISSLLAVAGLLASYIPARRALTVDAMTALRQE